MLELLESMLNDMTWSDAWSLERTLVFRAKYEGVFAAVHPELNVATTHPVVLAKYMRDVETGLRISRDHVLWVVANFLPHYRPMDEDYGLFWTSLLK